MTGPTVLSPIQQDTLAVLCVTGRGATASKLAHVSGAGPSTLTSLVTLGLLVRTEAGSLEPLYHLTESGRALVCAAINTDPEGDTTMTDEITATETTEDEAAAPAEDTPAVAAPAKRGRKNTPLPAADAGDVEDVTGAPNPPVEPKAKKKTGPSAEVKGLYDDIVKQIKALTTRPKTETKSRYLRIGNTDGKTIAYVNFPSSKHVRVCVVKADGGGEHITKVGDPAGITEVVTHAQARVAALKAKKETAKA